MAGLPGSMRRRTLTCSEEVAQLCTSALGTPGSNRGARLVSPSVCRGSRRCNWVCAERAYPFDPADCADPQHARDDGAACRGTQECVNAINAGSRADRAWNVLAHNECCATSPTTSSRRDAEPNLLRHIFLIPPRANWWWTGTSAPAAWWRNSGPTPAPTWTSRRCWRCWTAWAGRARCLRTADPRGGRARRRPARIQQLAARQAGLPADHLPAGDASGPEAGNAAGGGRPARGVGLRPYFTRPGP